MAFTVQDSLPLIASILIRCTQGAVPVAEIERAGGPPAKIAGRVGSRCLPELRRELARLGWAATVYYQRRGAGQPARFEVR